MTKFEATDESLAAHAALVRAQEAFNVRLEAFTKEAVIAIDDIANHIGKPIWHSPTGVFMGKVAGYLFDYDEIDQGFTIEGYLYSCTDDPDVQKEVAVADMTFSEPKPALEYDELNEGEPAALAKTKVRKSKGKSNATD